MWFFSIVKRIIVFTLSVKTTLKRDILKVESKFISNNLHRDIVAEKKVSSGHNNVFIRVNRIT